MTCCLHLQDIQLSDTEQVLIICSSKIDQLGRGTLRRPHATGKPGPSPIKNLRRYLFLHPPGDGPLLVYDDGSVLKRHQFAAVICKAVAACSLSASEFAPHPFRIAAATTTAHWGLSVDRIKDMGRWKSEAYKGYIQKWR